MISHMNESIMSVQFMEMELFNNSRYHKCPQHCQMITTTCYLDLSTPVWWALLNFETNCYLPDLLSRWGGVFQIGAIMDWCYY